MFIVQISKNNEKKQLTCIDFREFIGKYTHSQEYTWNVDWVRTDDIDFTTRLQEHNMELQEFTDQSLNNLLRFCRIILHRVVEERKTMLSAQHMKMFCEHFSDSFEKVNYNINELLSKYRNCGAGLCEYRPNRLAGYDFIGNNVTVNFTDENIDYITYKLNPKKLFKEALKYTLTHNPKTSPAKTNIHIQSVETLTCNIENHTDLDDNQIPGQINIFDYIGC